MYYYVLMLSCFVTDACLRCQGESKKDSYGKQDCVVVWGECNHSFHFCCMSLWVKQNNRCPLCQQEWSIQRMGKQIFEQLGNCTVLETYFSKNIYFKNDMVEIYKLDKFIQYIMLNELQLFVACYIFLLILQLSPQTLLQLT